MEDHTTARGFELALSRDAFIEQLEGILDSAYRLATVILLDYAAAEDAVHRAALRAWSRYGRLGGEVISFRTWFLAIVVSHCRRVRLWRLLTLRRRELGRLNPESKVVAGLPLASRLALFCRVSLDLPPDEVARVVGTSPGRVASRIYWAGKRAEAELQRRLEELEAEEE